MKIWYLKRQILEFHEMLVRDIVNVFLSIRCTNSGILFLLNSLVAAEEPEEEGGKSRWPEAGAGHRLSQNLPGGAVPEISDAPRKRKFTHFIRAIEFWDSLCVKFETILDSLKYNWYEPCVKISSRYYINISLTCTRQK